MNILGIILIGLGISLIVGGGIPPYGFSHLPVLLDGYKRAKSEGQEPTLDEKSAYSIHMAHKFGTYLVIIGGVVWGIGFLI